MVVIFVQKSWIDGIGDMAKLLHFRSEGENCLSLLAAENTIKLNYPFVQAQIIANLSDPPLTKAAFPVFIPTSAIIGMFDLTESEVQAYGFQPPKAKRLPLE
jgi:hypothetical protein